MRTLGKITAIAAMATATATSIAVPADARTRHHHYYGKTPIITAPAAIHPEGPG